jgi:ElaB/YqjD/DUF883 family membrane-anchored ribosome-binding protein
MEGATTKAQVEELTEKLAALKKDFAELAKLTKDKVVTGTTSWSKEHPIATLGIVGGIGFVLGLLVRRNRG